MTQRGIWRIAPLGVLAPGSAHPRPSAQPPIDTNGIFLAHMSAESLSNISPNPSEVIYEVSEALVNFWKYPSLFAQIYHSAGGSQVLEPQDNFWNYPPFATKYSAGGRGVWIFIFLWVSSPYKISELYDNPFCGFEQGYQLKKKKRKISARAEQHNISINMKMAGPL